MKSDTITIERIETLATITRMVWERIAAIRQEVIDGDTTPGEAAAEINEIIANINAANQ